MGPQVRLCYDMTHHESDQGGVDCQERMLKDTWNREEPMDRSGCTTVGVSRQPCRRFSGPC